MAELTAEFNTRPLELAAAKSEAIIFQALQGAMRDILYGFQTRHARDRMSGRPGVATRSAQLKRSWKVVIQGDKSSNLRGTYVTNSRYARMQEFGGTVRPTNAKMLAIPLRAAVTAAGVGRFGGPLRNILAAAFPGGTFVRRTRSGALILFGKPSADADPVALFVLKSQVTIPPRLGTRELWTKSQPEHQKQLTAWVAYANAQLVAASKGGG